MSVSQVLSKLKSILEKIEKLDAEVKMAYPTDVQWVDLNDLCSNLSKAMARLQGKFKSLEKSQKEKTQEESKTFLSNMKSSVKNLFADGELQYPSLFENNIIKIFYDEDSSQRVPTPKRLGSTRQRCEKIRNLSPDGVLTWAIAVAPSYWVGGSMSSNVFEYLLCNVEPELAPTWPSSIRETLYMLRKDESLQKSPGYKKFLEDIDASTRQTGKRRRIEDLTEPENDFREIKDTYAVLPTTSISNLPEPFQTAVRNSRLWKWERDREMLTTSCLATLFPKDFTHDVSLTIVCGHNDGYRLNDIFGLQYEPLLIPPTEKRDMYTNLPTTSILNLPEPFQTAVRNSRLWKWERDREMLTTSCLATLFPKDFTHDVSLTIWCGHNDGYRLNDIFGLQHHIPS